MESKQTAISTSSILPLHIRSGKQSLSHAVSEESSNLDSSSLQTDRSQEDGNASDPGRPASSLTTDSEPEANTTISLLPSEPTTPINSLLSLSETPYKLLAAHHPVTGRVYKIQALSGKGVGMLATAVIPTGTRLLAEKPIMTVQRRDWQYDRTQRNAVVSAYLSLPHPYMQLFDALHHAPSQFQDWHGMIETEYNDAAPFGPEDPPPDVPFDGVLSRIEQSRVMAVFSTNAFGVCASSSSQNVAAAICAEASRLNHSCTPNIQFTWNENVLGGAITMHALRDILPGEEITASYVDLLRSTAERKEKLHNAYGFDCACAVCGANDEVIAASDTRRHTIREGLFTCRTARQDEPWMRELSADFKERLDLTVGLLKEEGLVNLILSNALEMGIVPTKDRVYLRQALAVLKRCVGADHMWYLAVQGLLPDLDDDDDDAAESSFQALADVHEGTNASTLESAANPPPQAESSTADVATESSAAAAAAAASTSSCAVGHSVGAGAPAPEMASTASDEPAAQTIAPAFPASDESDSNVEFTDTDAADFDDIPCFDDDIPCFDGACDDAAVPPRIFTGYTAPASASSSGADSDTDTESDGALRRNLVAQKKETKKEKLHKKDDVAAGRVRKRRSRRAQRQLASASASTSASDSDNGSDSDIPLGNKLVAAKKKKKKAKESQKAKEKEDEGEGTKREKFDTLTLTTGRTERCYALVPLGRLRRNYNDIVKCGCRCHDDCVECGCAAAEEEEENEGKGKGKEEGGNERMHLVLR